MIFVTVGTHEQGFDRLIEFIDNLGLDNVFIQIGYSKYIPKNTKYTKFLSFSEFNKYMENADVIITHGGPSSFMKAISLGKQPIVVPRLKKYNEHVNNHQLEFCNKVVSKGYNMIVLTKLEKIVESIEIVRKTRLNFVSNNENFNKLFCEEIEKV